MKIEQNHRACAELLMDDYGIPKKELAVVATEVKKIWDAVQMPHCLIIAGVRGYRTIPATRALKSFLEERQTHPPKHHARESF